MNKNCYVMEKTELIEAEFIGIFQRSNVIDPSPMIGGHPGGVNAYPVAVVKLNGKFKEVKPSEVIFHEE